MEMKLIENQNKFWDITCTQTTWTNKTWGPPRRELLWALVIALLDEDLLSKALSAVLKKFEAQCESETKYN